MSLRAFRVVALLTAIGLCAAAPPAAAQQPDASTGPDATVCGTTVPPPAAQPPANSGPVVYLIAPCFDAQGNVTLVDQETYLYYIRVPTSRPSQGVWVPWNETTEQAVRDDFKRLWATGFLDNLSIDTSDYRFANGVVGKILTYHIEERERVKIIEYAGSKKVDTHAIDERVRTQNVEIRADSFVDIATIRKVEGLLTDMLKEKGFPYGSVSHQITPMPGGPKLVNLKFTLNEGPSVKIRRINFDGNEAMDDRRLRRQMKNNKTHWIFSWMTSSGTYHADKFEEDAERVTEFYRNHGYVRANVGEAQIVPLKDSGDGKTRWVELKIPVAEGNRYKVGDFAFEGNSVIKSDGLRTLFKMKTGEYYNNRKIVEGYKRMKDTYGVGGYWELNGYPNFKFSDEPDPAAPAVPAALVAPAAKSGPPTVDVTLTVQEGPQYFVNRISFAGNTTTYDTVVRREMQLLENSVFNTEALKYSVRRINQLGFFKALDENRDIKLDKTPDGKNRVDVKVQLEEQNRNQINFGAGVSQFEGFFGQLSFQTANFLGRGESLTVSVQSGSRAQNYSLGFTEPFLFQRNITGGFNVFRSDVRYVGQFTQRSAGTVVTLGLPLGRGFTRLYTNYSLERVRVTEINPAFQNQQVLARNPFLRDSLLISQAGQTGGERIISKITPTIVHNTVDQPIFPTTGTRLTAAIDLAGIGGNVSYYKPSLETVWYWRQKNRLTFGTRARAEFIGQKAGSKELPIFERLFLGGEMDLRGFDLRTVGPTDQISGLVLGGNKSLLLNVEEAITIAPQARVIFFFDAGQVRNFGENFKWNETLTELLSSPLPLLVDPYAPAVGLRDQNYVQPTLSYSAAAFKTSLGAELRFFMPVLNVPFRLIFAEDPSRAGILDSTLQRQRAFQFRFAVGTTF